MLPSITLGMSKPSFFSIFTPQGEISEQRMKCHLMMLDAKGFVLQLKSEVPGYPYDKVECYAQLPMNRLVSECNPCLCISLPFHFLIMLL